MADGVNEVPSGSKPRTQGNDSLDGEPERKRMKAMQNLEHIYEPLYVKGMYSDVTVHMLGKDWKLHKEIVKVSPYFASMFSGSWKESGQEVINIEVPDENITLDAISLVFSSLYCGSVDWEKEEIVPILATANLFQLKQLIDKCEQLMKSSLEMSNVASFYNAAVSYGVISVKSLATQWLKANILTSRVIVDYSFLKQISLELMTEIVSSVDLVPGTSEHRLYAFLKNWLFSLLSKDNETEIVTLDEFFKKMKQETPFLDTEVGKKYILPFHSLRMKYILMEYAVKPDNISTNNLIPQEWMNAGYKDICETTYLIHQGKDLGPTSLREEQFEKYCYRFSKHWKTKSDPQHSWYQINFLFGINLEFRLRENSFTIVRISSHKERKLTLVQEYYNIAVKVSLNWPDEKNFIKKTMSSGLKFFSLKLEEEKELLSLPEGLTYPLYAVVKVLVHTPQE